MALTPKQDRFISEYLIDFNATQAAIRAGYSKDTAGSIGSENLSKPEIAQALQERATAMQIKTGLTAERLLKEVERLAFFDPRKLYDENGNLKRVNDLDDDTAAALAGFEVTEEFEGSGQERQSIGFTKKMKWYDKNVAIDKGMRYFGMLKDKVEHTGKDGESLIPKMDTLELARRVAFVLAGASAKIKD